MKNILFAALLGGASALILTPATASAQTTAPAGQAPSAKEMKKIRKEREKNGPEVYKGTVAEQRRILTDAPGAEKDDESGDASTSRKTRKSKKN
jgi:hypothetical protein